MVNPGDILLELAVSAFVVLIVLVIFIVGYFEFGRTKKKK
jgi:hypothetical protein